MKSFGATAGLLFIMYNIQVFMEKFTCMHDHKVFVQHFILFKIHLISEMEFWYRIENLWRVIKDATFHLLPICHHLSNNYPFWVYESRLLPLGVVYHYPLWNTTFCQLLFAPCIICVLFLIHVMITGIWTSLTCDLFCER